MRSDYRAETLKKINGALQAGYFIEATVIVLQFFESIVFVRLGKEKGFKVHEKKYKELFERYPKQVLSMATLIGIIDEKSHTLYLQLTQCRNHLVHTLFSKGRYDSDEKIKKMIINFWHNVVINFLTSQRDQVEIKLKEIEKEKRFLEEGRKIVQKYPEGTKIERMKIERWKIVD